jgi:hypothetical protein
MGFLTMACAALDLFSQIRALGFFLAVLKLLWLELSAATEATTTFNKVVLRDLFSACEEIPHPVPASRGGRGEGDGSLFLAGLRGGREEIALVHEHDTWRWSARFP